MWVPSRPRVLRSRGISAPLLLGSRMVEESEMGSQGLHITGEDRAQQPEPAASHWFICTAAGVTLCGVCVTPLRGAALF